MKIKKIIQVSTSSHSLTMQDFEKDIKRGWYLKLAKRLKKYYPKLDVEAWTIERKYKKERDEFIDDIKLRIFPTNYSLRHGLEISLDMINALKNEQEKLGNDEIIIVHFHEYHSLQVYLTLMKIDKKKMKFVAQHHGGRSPFKNLKKYYRFYIVLPIIMMLQILENNYLKKINLFYALSDEEIEYLKKVDEKSNVKFQTMGITNNYFKIANKNESRRNLGLDLKKKYIIYLGRIKSTKGIKELLDAIKETPEVHLLLIGGGIDYQKYLDYAKKINLKNFTFLGQIYGKKKLEYLSSADALILPSHTEGAPVVIMEAIAKNLPVIATKVGGIPKMIRDNREGILINVNSKKEIVKALKEIISWDKEVRKHANKYKWKKIIESTMEDYKSL